MTRRARLSVSVSPSVTCRWHPAESSKSRDSDPLQVTDISASLAQGQPEKEGRLQQCVECGRSFASSALLLQHSKEAHGRERIHVCPVCRKAFKRATHLKVRALRPGARAHTHTYIHSDRDLEGHRS